MVLTEQSCCCCSLTMCNLHYACHIVTWVLRMMCGIQISTSTASSMPPWLCGPLPSALCNFHLTYCSHDISFLPIALTCVPCTASLASLSLSLLLSLTASCHHYCQPEYTCSSPSPSFRTSALSVVPSTPLSPASGSPGAQHTGPTRVMPCLAHWVMWYWLWPTTWLRRPPLYPSTEVPALRRAGARPEHDQGSRKPQQCLHRFRFAGSTRIAWTESQARGCEQGVGKARHKGYGRRGMAKGRARPVFK